MTIWYNILSDKIGISPWIQNCGYGPCLTVQYYDGPYDTKFAYVVPNHGSGGWVYIGEI